MLHDYSAHPEYNRGTLNANHQDLLKLANELTADVIERVEGAHGLGGKHKDDFRERTFTSKVGISGTPDFVRYYDSSVGLVIDLKFGYNVVERADLNLQLRVYAVLANARFVSIVQPRAAIDERITIAEYTPQDLIDSAAQIQSILEASAKPDAPLRASEEACRYCKAKLICPEFQSKMLVPAIITPDKALSVAAREAYLVQRLGELKDDQLEKVVAAVKLSEMIKDSAWDEVRRRGGTEHLEVGKESEVREIANVRRAMALLSLAGLDKAQTFDCVSKMALKKIEEVVRKKNPTWTWKQSNEWIDKKLNSVIELQTRKGKITSKGSL